MQRRRSVSSQKAHPSANPADSTSGPAGGEGPSALHLNTKRGPPWLKPIALFQKNPDCCNDNNSSSTGDDVDGGDLAYSSGGINVRKCSSATAPAAAGVATASSRQKLPISINSSGCSVNGVLNDSVDERSNGINSRGSGININSWKLKSTVLGLLFRLVFWLPLTLIGMLMETACRVFLRPVVRHVLRIDSTDINSRFSSTSTTVTTTAATSPCSSHPFLNFRDPPRWLVRAVSKPFRSLNPPVVALGANHLEEVCRLGRENQTCSSGPAGTAAAMGGSSSNAAVLFVGTQNLLGLSVAPFLDQVCGMKQK